MPSASNTAPQHPPELVMTCAVTGPVSAADNMRPVRLVPPACHESCELAGSTRLSLKLILVTPAMLPSLSSYRSDADLSGMYGVSYPVPLGSCEERTTDGLPAL